MPGHSTTREQALETMQRAQMLMQVAQHLANGNLGVMCNNLASALLSTQATALLRTLEEGTPEQLEQLREGFRMCAADILRIAESSDPAQTLRMIAEAVSVGRGDTFGPVEFTGQVRG